MEKEMIGFYVSGHPLDAYSNFLRQESLNSIDSLAQAKDGEPVKIGGIINHVRQVVTRKGEIMAQFVIEDFTGTMGCIAFPRTFEHFGDLIQIDQVVVIEGRINCQDEEIKVFCQTIRPPAKEKKIDAKLYIKMKNGEIRLDQVQKILIHAPGDTPVYLYNDDTKKSLVVQKKYWVSPSEEMMSKLKTLFGPENVILKKR